MTLQTIKLIIGGVLLVHGLGHVGALIAIAVDWQQRGTATGAWLPARSWLIPTLTPQAAKAVASSFWILATLGFVAASMSFWGLVLPGDTWRLLALASAVVSACGIILFFGTWPVFNTLAALAVNAAVFVTQLWLRWPPETMFGN